METYEGKTIMVSYALAKHHIWNEEDFTNLDSSIVTIELHSLNQLADGGLYKIVPILRRLLIRHKILNIRIGERYLDTSTLMEMINLDANWREIVKARRKNDKVGRPKIEFSLIEAQKLMDRGLSQNRVCKLLKISRPTLNRRMKEQEK